MLDPGQQCLAVHGEDFRVVEDVLAHEGIEGFVAVGEGVDCLLYTSPSPRDVEESRMPSSA